MIGEKPISGIVTGLKLTAVFSKHLRASVNVKQISLDDFDKLKVIGKGGFAEKVYLARKKDSGSLVAIKTMCKKFIMEEQGRYEQVFGELKVMQKLIGNPFVIELKHAFESKDYLHFAMEFCCGGELFYLLQCKGRFREKEACFYFGEMLLGLEYIHS